MQKKIQTHTLASTRIMLSFPDLGKLWAFALTLSHHNLEINTRLNTLICDCTDVDTDRAIQKFDATIFNDVKNNN